MHIFNELSFYFSVEVIVLFFLSLAFLLLLKIKYDFIVFLNIFFLFFAVMEPSPSDILFIFLVLFILVKEKVDFKKIKNQGFFYTLLYLYIVLNVIQAINIGDYQQGIYFLAVTFYLVCYSFFIFLYSSKENYIYIGKAYILSSSVSALIGIIGNAGYFCSYIMYDTFRTKGLFKDPNVFGPFLIPSVILLIDDLKGKKIFIGNPLVSIILILTHIFGIIVSFSRGAWVNFIFAFICYLVLNFKNTSKTRFIIYLLILTMTLVIFWTHIVDEDFKEFLQERSRLQNYDLWRFTAQKAALSLICDNFFGYGPGQYSITIVNEIGRQIDAHSLYMRVLLENGIIGFILLMTVLVYIVIKLAINKKNESILKSTVLLPILCGILVNSLVIDTLHWRHFWLFIGLSISVINDTTSNRGAGRELCGGQSIN